MSVPTYLGRGGLARFLGIGESRVDQLNPAPDATVDGRSIWSLESARRLKAEREARAAQRGKHGRRPGRKEAMSSAADSAA